LIDEYQKRWVSSYKTSSPQATIDVKSGRTIPWSPDQATLWKLWSDVERAEAKVSESDAYFVSMATVPSRRQGARDAMRLGHKLALFLGARDRSNADRWRQQVGSLQLVFRTVPFDEEKTGPSRPGRSASEAARKTW
jgi:hypothetical protein